MFNMLEVKHIMLEVKHIEQSNNDVQQCNTVKQGIARDGRTDASPHQFRFGARVSSDQPRHGKATQFFHTPWSCETHRRKQDAQC